MRKTLRNIILPSIIIGGLLFPSCGKNMPKEVTEQVTGEENAYDEALDIAKDPGKFARESITGKTIEPEKKKGIIERVFTKEPRTLEDYFLQGKELGGIILVPEKHIINDTTDIKANPYIFHEREIAKTRTREGYENLTGMGVGTYMPTTKKNLLPLLQESPIEQNISPLLMSIFQFENKIHAWEFLNERGKEMDIGYSGNDETILAFIKENTVPLIIIRNDLDVNDEKKYLNSLINYQKRIGGEFYMSNWGDINIYDTLNIPPSESGKYFREALEFQKKFYDMTDNELINSFINWLDLTPIKERYKKGLISKEEFMGELVDWGKEKNRKIYFSLPNMNKIIMEFANSSASPVRDEFYIMDIASNLGVRGLKRYLE